MTDFGDRLAAIEAQLAAGPTLSDLPLKQLQDKLEQDWQPQASVLLGSNSITPAMIANLLDLGGASLAIRVSAASVPTSWSGASARSFTGTVAHGMDKTPLIVLPMAVDNTGLTADPVIICFAYTATQFSFRAQTVDGQLPGAGVTHPSFRWAAIG